MRMKRLSRSSRPTGPKMRVPRGLLLVVDEHGGVLVEADVAAVGPPLLLLDADDDALHDVALLHGRAGDGVLDGGDEDVADRRVAALGAAEHLDAQHLLGAAVVGDPEAGLLLDHSGPLQDLDQAPALQLRQRPGLLDAHAVADLEVVRSRRGRTASWPLHRLAVQRMADAVDHRDHRGLVHRGGRDDALADLAAGSGAASSVAAVVGHHVASPALASRPSASAAAISRARSSVLMPGDCPCAAAPRRAVLSSWPVTCWNRRLNSSCLVSASRSTSASSSEVARARLRLRPSERLLPGDEAWP